MRLNTTPIRVLQVLGGLEAGGAESFVMNLYRAVDKEKVQFDFVKHIEHKGVFADEIAQMNGKIYRCPQYTGKNHFILQVVGIPSLRSIRSTM